MGEDENLSAEELIEKAIKLNPKTKNTKGYLTSRRNSARRACSESLDGTRENGRRASLSARSAVAPERASVAHREFARAWEAVEFLCCRKTKLMKDLSRGWAPAARE